MHPQFLTQQLGNAQDQLVQGDFAGVIKTCEPLLNYLPRQSSTRVQVLGLLGLAHGMLEQYQDSYDLFTEALTIDPTNAELWYNRGLASRYTTRFGQAVRDFERAVELGKHMGELTPRFAEELAKSRADAEEAMQLYGEDITLAQYIEREELFMQAMSSMKRSKWEEAEQSFRRLIEMGGRLSQYWGNLGVSLIMQLRYDEAEAAWNHALAIDPDYSFARNNLKKLPEIRQAGGPQGTEITEIAPKKGLKQSITLYNKQNDSNSSAVPHITIQKVGDSIIRTGVVRGKQPQRYRFFLNPYQHERFTKCPKCGFRTLQRKYPLAIHVEPDHPIVLNKICHYCPNCDLLIAHQDQVAVQLAAHFATINPQLIGNSYLVLGTVDKAEWRQGMQGELSTEEMLEHLHDFKEVVTFVRG